MRQKRKRVVVLVANSIEARVALDYKKQHPKEIVRLISVDISSMLFFDKRDIDHTPIFKLLKLSESNEKYYLAPYVLARRFLTFSKVRKKLQVGDLDLCLPLLEMLKFRMVFCLEQYYILISLREKLSFQKIVSSDQVISVEVLTEFVRDNNLVKEDLYVGKKNYFKWLSYGVNWWHSVRSRLARNLVALKCLNCVFFWLGGGSRSVSSLVHGKEKLVLFFSSGLNLASYHGAVKYLEKKIMVNVIVNKQTLLDRFFYNRYLLDVYELDDRNAKLVRKVNSFSRKLLKIANNIENLDVSKIKLSVTFGIDKFIVRELLKKNTSYLLKNWMSNFARYYFHAKLLVSRLKPCLVVNTHDPGPSGLAFTLVAKEKGIPSVVLLHGSPSRVHFFFADKQIVWGDLMKRFLVESGSKANKLDVGGHPVYFDYKRFFSRQKKPNRKTINIGIITSGFGVNEINQVEFFFKLLPQLAKLRFSKTIFVRTHFTQRLDGLKALAKKNGLCLKLNPPCLLEEFVLDCDIVITQDSTAALVPLIAGKPTIAMPSWMPFTDRGFVLDSEVFFRPTESQPVDKLIRNILKNKQLRVKNRVKQKQFLRKYCNKIDHLSGKRVAKKLLKFV